MKYPNKIGSIACFSCLCMPISAYADINLNGFATIGLGQVVNTNVEDGKGQIYGIEEDISLAQGSLIGLQFGADMGDGLTATAQIISKGSNDWVPETEWAYISYDVSDQVRIIAGKQRSPYYMYSEFVDVGYAYHWISPPEGVYSLPFDSTNSVSAIINNYFGDFETNLQLMYGQNEKDQVLHRSNVNEKGHSKRSGLEQLEFGYDSTGAASLGLNDSKIRSSSSALNSGLSSSNCFTASRP